MLSVLATVPIVNLSILYIVYIYRYGNKQLRYLILYTSWYEEIRMTEVWLLYYIKHNILLYFCAQIEKKREYIDKI